MRENVQKVIDAMNAGVITAYQVHKNTGLSQGQLAGFKHGTQSIDNMTIKTAETLINYYKGVIKMKNLENVKQAVTRAEEHLIENNLGSFYITLYESRAALLEDYDEELHEDMIDYLDSQQAPQNEPFVVIDRSGLDFEDSLVILLNEFEDHMDLLVYVDSEYKIDSDLYEYEKIEAVKPHLTIKNLMASYGNGDGTDDLEFILEDGRTVFVRNAEVEEDNEDEDYWEKGDNLKKAVEESHVDYIEIK